MAPGGDPRPAQQAPESATAAAAATDAPGGAPDAAFDGEHHEGGAQSRRDADGEGGRAGDGAEQLTRKRALQDVEGGAAAVVEGDRSAEGMRCGGDSHTVDQGVRAVDGQGRQLKRAKGDMASSSFQPTADSTAAASAAPAASAESGAGGQVLAAMTTEPAAQHPNAPAAAGPATNTSVPALQIDPTPAPQTNTAYPDVSQLPSPKPVEPPVTPGHSHLQIPPAQVRGGPGLRPPGAPGPGSAIAAGASALGQSNPVAQQPQVRPAGAEDANASAPGVASPAPPNPVEVPMPIVTDKGLQEILEPLAHIGHDIWNVMYKVTNHLRLENRFHWGNLLSQDSSQPSVQLRGSSFSVGRSSRADLQLRDPSLSVTIFRLIYTTNPNRVVIESQSNSTRVAVNNRQLVKRVPLFIKSGDEISVTGTSKSYSFILQLVPVKVRDLGNANAVPAIPPPPSSVNQTQLPRLAPLPTPAVPMELSSSRVPLVNQQNTTPTPGPVPGPLSGAGSTPNAQANTAPPTSGNAQRGTDPDAVRAPGTASDQTPQTTQPPSAQDKGRTDMPSGSASSRGPVGTALPAISVPNMAMGENNAKSPGLGTAPSGATTQPRLDSLPNLCAAIKGPEGDKKDKPDKKVRFAAEDEVFTLPERDQQANSWKQLSEESVEFYKKIGEKFFADHVTKPEDLKVSFSEFPYCYLSEDLKNLLITAAFTYLTNPDVAKLTSKLQSVSRRIVLAGPHTTEVYQEKLVRALAAHFKASLFVIDAGSLQQVIDPAGNEDEGGAQPSEGGLAGGSDSMAVDPPEVTKPDDLPYTPMDAAPDPSMLPTNLNPAGNKGDPGLQSLTPTPSKPDNVSTRAKPPGDDATGPEEPVPAPNPSGRSAIWPLVKDESLAGPKPPFSSPPGRSGAGAGGLKVGDRVRYIGNSPSGVRYDPRKGGYRNVLLLPPPIIPSSHSIEECPDRGYGDKLFRRHGSSKKGDSRTENPKGPSVGMKGKVVITFEESRRVGVRFDDPVPGGHNLGNHCDDSHGFFCVSRELALDEDQSPTVQTIILDAIVAAAKDEKNQPLVVFLKDAERRVQDGHEQSWQFRSALERLDGRCIILGSVVARARSGSTYGVSTGSAGMGSVILKSGHPPGVGGAMDPSNPHHAVLDISLLDQISRVEERLENVNRTARAIGKFFPVRLAITPPAEPEKLAEWEKELDEDLKGLKKRSNLTRLKAVLSQCNIEVEKLDDVQQLAEDVLSIESLERLIGFAVSSRLMERNSSLPETTNATAAPTESEDRPTFLLTKSSILRGFEILKSLKPEAVDPTINKSLRDVKCENDFERKLLAEVVPASEIGVKFGDIGALDRCKESLQEVVMLPLKRPELFRRGNLTKPCRGVLLFGPPGTGKTMLAKAVATESGANFINISMAAVASKWFGEAEKYVRAVFTLARKISPSVIFIDEVDSMLGKRDKHGEHEAMRKLKNEFMASWDGLKTTESERILVLAATNRPFDIDEAVLRRLPRRLLVDLPDAENRTKILRVILEAEELDNTVDLDTLAEELDGYSGSDLRNLCMAAAYKPVREVIAAEKKREEKDREKAKPVPEPEAEAEAPYLRPLRQSDFIDAKDEVSASVSEDAFSIAELRKWNDTYGEGGSRRPGSLTYFL